MTKKELSQSLATNSADVTSNAAAERIVNTLFETIKNSLTTGELVDISGFGKFSTKLQAGKTGTIPGSKPAKQYTTKDKNVPVFKFSSVVKTSVAAGK